MNVSGSIRMPKVVHYGEGSINYLPEEVRQLGERVLIISDKPMNDLGYVEDIQTKLHNNDMFTATYLGIDAETEDIHVQEALDICKEKQCNVIVALGGGSCIDAAKAVAVQVNNKKELIEYMKGTMIEKDPMPVIAIPTTAGTGSEVTDALVVTNTKKDIKMMIKQPKITPEVAIVDPEYTVSVPRSLTTATGIDALSHGIEAFLSKRSHPFTDHLALSSIKAIMDNIKKVFDDGENIAARATMSFASMQAGIAFSNASVALVHGMSRPIGALFNIPHGISNAMLLAPVLEFSYEDCKAELAQIGRTVDKGMVGEPDEKVANEFISSIKQLCAYLEIKNLKDWGVDEQKFMNSLEKMAEDALESGSPSNNPRTPTKEEIIQLYKKCYFYDFTS